MGPCSLSPIQAWHDDGEHITVHTTDVRKGSVHKSNALSGPLVREQAKELAASLREDNFKVSIGRLEWCKKKENIGFKKLHGDAIEAADTVSRDDQWGQMKQDYTEKKNMGMQNLDLFLSAA